MGWLAALAAANLRNAFARPGPALAAAAFMCANNLIMFAVWLIYFSAFSSLRGWRQDDLALLVGIIACAFGLVVTLAGGVRDLGRAIADGALDVQLGRPRHPLPGLLMSRCLPSGAGDVLSAPVFWLVFAGREAWELPYLVLLSAAAAVVLGAAAAIAQCIVFWWPRAVQLAEDAFELFLMTAFYPQHVFGPLLRLLLFTAFPTAFVALLPVEAVREGSALKALAVVGAAAVYAALAWFVFERGLKRYASGNRMIENR